ncbi:putative RNA-binding protein C4F6.14 [Exophiala dermatitidis]
MEQGTKRRKLSSGSYEAVSPAVSNTNTTAQAAALSAEDQQPTKDHRRSLFVRSLPASVTTERLTEFFSESFPIKHATVVLDPQTKVSRGFGFVTFVDAEDTQAALAQFNNAVLDGRKIKVEVAEARHRDTEDGAVAGAEGTKKKGGKNITAEKIREQIQKSRAEVQPPRLIVRNLPWSIKTGDDLAGLFRSYGKVKHAVVPKKGPRVQYGFGIVVLRGKKNAEKAIAGVNGKVVDGRTLAVDWAVDKQTWEEQQQQQQQQQGTTEAAQASGGDEGSKMQQHQAKNAKKADGITPSEEVDSDEEDLQEEEHIHNDDDTDASDDGSDEDGSADLDAEEDESENDLSEAESDEGDRNRDTRNDSTVFIRNLPFTADDDILKEHFSQHFGPVRYARVVYDPETERSRGTAFVCFFNQEDAKECVKNAPKHESPGDKAADNNSKKRKAETLKHSILQNEASDPSGKYTLDGRVLQVSRALSREDANQRASEASEKRDIRDRDKRRLYLLSEGSISKSSKLYELLGKAEIDIRETSQRQRQRLIKSNPNLCLSLTRLSVRNIPRGIGSKELKALAREAVVGFAKDVKEGLRQPLSKEELKRGGEEMREAERRRKLAGKGIVKQAKVVFENKEGSKVKEGAGRSRGYGFIEYVTHRNALAGLRWLNGHYVKAPNSGGEKGKRLIVEFAIENAQVVQRRNERERKFKELGPKPKDGPDKEHAGGVGRSASERKDRNLKRKRDGKSNGKNQAKPAGAGAGAAASAEASKDVDDEEKNRIAKRNRIIAKKRQARKARKG